MKPSKEYSRHAFIGHMHTCVCVCTYVCACACVGGVCVCMYESSKTSTESKEGRTRRNDLRLPQGCPSHGTTAHVQCIGHDV